ncbi:MAG: ABC transporter permease, partial [Myxococcota bacterium]
VFRIGEPVQEMSWESYEQITKHPEVKWTVPFALGDSVQGFRVLGTSESYFEHYRYGESRELEFLTGSRFAGEHQAVLGSDVAQALGWTIGKHFPIQHGIAHDAHSHDHAEFEVVGILAPTGTPVDRTVHVPIDSLGEVHDHEHGIESVSSALIGLRSKIGLLRMRAWINGYASEPLMAVMPARAFQQLWSTVSSAESALRVIGILVSLAGLIALAATMLSTTQERRREMALLRSVGASPVHVAVLIVGEAMLIAAASAGFALLGVFVIGLLSGESLAVNFGLRLSSLPIQTGELPWVFAFLVTAALVSLVPALVSYRRSLSDGLMVQG